MPVRFWLALAGMCVAGLAALPIASAVYLHLTELARHPFFAGADLWTLATAWTLYITDPGPRLLNKVEVAVAGAAGLMPFGICASLAIGAARETEDAPLHGKTEWARRAEAVRSGVTYSRTPPDNAVIIGRQGTGLTRRYLSLTGTEHVALYARTGAGKGVSFVIPNCLWWGGSLVAFDIKGGIYRRTAEQRRRMGQAVFFFAPTDPEHRTHRWNPYSVVPRGTAEAIGAIHRINHILIPPNLKAENPFWDNAARSAVNALAVILAETPGEALSVPAVRRLALRPDFREAVRALVVRARSAGRPLPQAAVDDALGWVDDPDDRTRSGVQRTIQAHLSLWADPAVAAAMEASDFDLRQLRTSPMSIYLGIPATHARRLRPVTALLFQQIVELNTDVEFQRLPEHGRREVLMMLDEKWATGPMPILADAAAFVREYGIRMAYVLQAQNQLVSLYGQEGAENLVENTGAEIYFGVKGVKTARRVSDEAGFDTVEETTTSRPRFFGWAQPARQTENEAARRRALVLPQEVQRLPPHRQIIFRAGIQPIRAGRVIYYRDRTFRDLEQDPPEVPRLCVVVTRDDGGTAEQERQREAAEARAAMERATEQQAAAQLDVARAEAQRLAAEAEEQEARATDAPARAAHAGERAREARAASTDAGRAAREAAATAEKVRQSVERLGGDAGPAIAAAAAAQARADEAAATARDLAQTHAVAVMAARVAKQRAAAVRRMADRARQILDRRERGAA